jgi:uncharacterized membrane protein YgcG
MLRLKLTILAGLAFGGFAHGQNLAVKGSLQDKSDRTAVSGATIKLGSINDSLQQYNTVTDRRGLFSISGLNHGNYILTISSVSYETLSREISLTAGQKELGIILFNKEAKELGEVTVVAKTPPARQKGDTLQYNASQFKVNPDANMEDMIKKMPGITVDNGTVTAQGEQVKKVTIDGRDFFGDDATAALRNLPAEIVDKIQVFDRLSDQARFTGFDDGNTQKAINIVTRADMRNGQFGRVFAGYGTDDRYNAGGNVSFFKGDRRISLVGLMNNINQQNFASQDLLGLTSSSGGRGGGSGRGGAGGRGGNGGFGGFGSSNNFLVGQQDGISKTSAAGINFSNLWAKKVQFSGSYFFNNSNVSNTQVSNTQTFLGGDSSQIYRQNTLSENDNYNNRINMRVEYKIDSANTLMIIPGLNFQNNKTVGNVFGVNMYNPADTISRLQNNNNRKTSGYNISNTLLYRHAFAKSGRTVSLNLNTGFNQKNGDTYLNAANTFFKSGIANTTEQNQYTGLVSNGYQLSANLAYTEPVGKEGQLQLNYNPSYSSSKSNQAAYHFDDNAGKYSVFDTSLSNKFSNAVTTQNAGISYRRGNRDKMFSLGVSFQNALLTSDRIFPTTVKVNKSFNNILPNAMFRYKLSEKSSVRIFYRASTNEPSVNQLQDVVDNYSNPLFWTSGNPQLEQQYGHALSTRYTFTDSRKGQTFFANVFLQQNDNYISNATYIPQKRDSIISINNSIDTLKVGSRLSKPVNLDGYLSIRSFFTFGIPLKFIKSNLNWNAGFSYSKLPGLTNNLANLSNNYTYTLGAVLASNISEYVDFTLSYSANFNNVKNTLQKQSDNHYFSQAAGFQMNLLSKNGWLFQNDLSNQLYKGLAGGFNQDYWLWNMSAGKKFLKNQSGELKLSVFDLLKQNRSITRNITESYIQDLQNQVLTQYFMLTFSYKLKNFGKAKMNNFNRQRGDHPFMF